MLVNGLTSPNPQKDNSDNKNSNKISPLEDPVHDQASYDHYLKDLAQSNKQIMISLSLIKFRKSVLINL